MAISNYGVMFVDTNIELQCDVRWHQNRTLVCCSLRPMSKLSVMSDETILNFSAMSPSNNKTVICYISTKIEKSKREINEKKQKF